MKKQILFNPDNSGDDICRTIKTTYHKISTANLIRGGCFGASGVIEIGDNEEINDGFGITGVMEETYPKIVGYTRDSKGKVVKRSLRDTSNAVTTFTGSCHNTDMYVAEPNVLRAERTEQCKQLRKQNGDKGMKFNDGNKQYSPRTDGISNTLSTITKDNMLAVPELRMEDGCLVDKEGRRYRIRKLSPTECFRLMDVDDSDIEKMKQAGIAKTNLYKLAGNSIVVYCMYHLFRKLFIEKDCETQTLL